MRKQFTIYRPLKRWTEQQLFLRNFKAISKQGFVYSMSLKKACDPRLNTEHPLAPAVGDPAVAR